MECPRCKEITLEVFAKYLHGNKVMAEYECLECGHYEQMPACRKEAHNDYFMVYNDTYPSRSGL